MMNKILIANKVTRLKIIAFRGFVTGLKATRARIIMPMMQQKMN